MIHVPRLKDENAAELFFGFGIGTVCRCHLAVLPNFALARSSHSQDGAYSEFVEKLGNAPQFPENR